METKIVKDKITREKWQKLSLLEQMGNIGSEVGRAAKWQGRDEASFWGAVARAMNLFDLTQADSRWNRRRKELDRAREVFADAVLGGGEYKSDLKDIEKYFMLFALAVNSGRK